MVRRNVFRGALSILALLGARVASADPINFTGNVAADFNPLTNTSVFVTPGATDPLSIGQPSWMTQNGWYSGWAIKDIRTSYDATTDTLSVGINTFVNKNGVQTIAGDAYGSGVEADPNLQKLAGGVNPTGFGGDKSITVAFAPDSPTTANTPGTPIVVAGVPADKSIAAQGTTDHFTVSTYKTPDLGLGRDYGTILTNNLGNLAFDPSASHPGFEFTIKNFSQIPGIDPTKGFWIEAYAGSLKDGSPGEEQVNFSRVPGAAPQTLTTPEPATMVFWSLVTGGAFWRLRRRRAQD